MFLVKTGNITYYIAPRMVIYIKLAAIGFYVIAVYQAYIALGSIGSKNKNEVCGCEHPPSPSIIKNILVYSLFVLPLILGFMLPDTAIGSDLAAKRGVNLNSSRILVNNSSNKLASATLQTPIPAADPIIKEEAAVNASPSPIPAEASLPKKTEETANPTDAQLKEMFKADHYDEQFSKLGMQLYKKDLIQVKVDGFIEILSSIDLFQENFIGKRIEISGFVYHEDDMKTNQFVVARFSVSCCSADAAPFGVMIESDEANLYPKDTWVSITGIIGKTTYLQNDIMKIKAIKIEKIPAAKDPYVYPNYDFVLN